VVTYWPRAQNGEVGTAPLSTGADCIQASTRPFGYTGLMAHESTSAREILTRARRMANLTQRELAEAAGITHGVVSRYEARRQQPTLQALERLVDAAGLELILDLRHRDPEDGDGELRGPVGRRLRENRLEVLEILRGQGFNHPRVQVPVARSQEGPVCLLVLVVDLITELPPTPTGAPGWGWAKLRASGQLDALLCTPVRILLPDEAALDGYDEADSVEL
jgi:transcriptional regulator with XRE-family HTH domain